MLDYTNTGSNYNPWDLKELEYKGGSLYHYTGVSASRGIFCYKDCPNFPADSISLRFTRIDCMAQRNDPNERKHIDKAVKKIAQKLFKRKRISYDFLRIICDYEPTYKGFYRLALDEIDNQFYKPQHRLLLDFGPVDYYVACFSTDANNSHIVREFKSTVRITFNADFSRRCKNPFSLSSSQVDPAGRIFDFSRNTYPLQSICECFPDTYLRQVEYIDTSADIDTIKSELVEEKLISIYKNYLDCSESNLGIVQEEIEDMYSLCDAFIKDIEFEPEKEVRFVIRLPQRKYFLEKYGSFPKLLTENHFVFDADRTYLQLPISEGFLTL